MKCELKDLKVKGIMDENGVKNFLIETPDNGSYIALRLPGGKFTVGDDGVSRTLKQCKEAVANDAVVFFADAEKASEEPRGGTWDCVDPCALLILHAGGIDDPEIKRTLDAFGWLLPDGLLDVEQAEANLEKWSKR